MQAQEHALRDECAAALMNLLLRQVADSGRDLESPEGIEQQGWLLGLLAGGLGIELLGERRERRGLEPLVALARASLQERGRELAQPSAPLPDVGRAVDGGPAACLAVVRLLWHAACEGGALPFAWSLAREPYGGHALHVGAPASADLVRLATEAARGLSGARFEPGDGAWTLRFAPGHFA
jgi:hypothetical protein